MTRLENYRKKLSALEAMRNVFMRKGQYAKYQEMSTDIKKVEALIKEAEEYELSVQVRDIKDMASKEELDAMGIIPLMIESYLISDMLVEVSTMIVDICKQYEFREIRIPKKLREAIKANNWFATFLTTTSPEMSDLLIRNETLNAALHKKYLNYIEQRLAPRKKKQNDTIDP